MRIQHAIALVALVLVSGCDEGSGPAPEYRPHEAGTVDHAPCLLGFTAVPVREISTGHELIEATINGKRGEFVLDTGANMTVLDQRYAPDFDLSAGSGVRGGALRVGDGGSASRASLESFRIGPVQVRQNHVVTADLGSLLQSLGRATGTKLYGIIGQDVLNEHRALIDVDRPMLYLIEGDRDPAPVPAERCTKQQGENRAKA